MLEQTDKNLLVEPAFEQAADDETLPAGDSGSADAAGPGPATGDEENA